MIEQRVTLRYGAQQIPAIVQAVQGDTGRDVIFELADYEIPAGATANYYIDKPDGNAIYNSAEVISSTEILAHLTEQALASPGRNNGQVRILADGEVITSFDFVLEVEAFRGILHLQSETEINIFDAAIQEAVDDAIEEIQAQTPVVTGMQNSIAPTYSSSSTYAVGDYVMYNAQLYKCITAITTAEAWTAAHWTQVPLVNDVNDLKSALSESLSENFEKLFDNRIYFFTGKAFINTSGTSTDFQPTSNSVYEYVIIDCVPGEVYTINAKGGTGPRAFAFAEENGSLQGLPKAIEGANLTDFVIVVPNGASKLIVNNDTSQKVGSVCKNQYFKNTLAADIDQVMAYNGKEIVWHGALLINGAGKWVEYHGNKSIIMRIEPKSMHGFVNNSSDYTVNYAFLKTSAHELNTDVDFASGTEKVSLLPKERQNVIVPNDAEYLWVDNTTDIDGLLVNRYLTIIDYADGYKETSLYYTNKYIGSGTTFADDPSRSGYVFKARPNNKYKITVENGNINFAFLTHNPGQQEVNVPFSFDKRRAYSGINEVTFIVPQGNTSYVWVAGKFNNVDFGVRVYDLGASSEITIAGIDSGAYRDTADYVCDGTNDEKEIQAAVDGLTNGGTLTLLPGNYYIDDFPTFDTGGPASVYSAIQFGYNGGIARTITMRGVIENKSYNTRLGSTVHITQTGKEHRHPYADVTALISGTGVVPAVEEGDASFAFTCINNANFENLYFYTVDAFEKLTVLDLRYFGDNHVRQVCIATEDYFYNRFHHLKQTTPQVDSYGMRSCRSSNDEMGRCCYEEMDIGGFYVGLELNGIEHLVCRRVDTCRNVYGLKFRANYKTCTFINCAYEGNYHGPLFLDTGCLTAIDWNTEPSLYYPDDPTGSPRKKAYETQPGGWHGTIEYTTQSEYEQPFWESGCGHNFVTRCLEDSLTGPTRNPEYLQKYFDTANNVWKTWNGTSWV